MKTASIYMLFFFFSLALMSCGGNEPSVDDSSPPNVLFIIIDDMNVDISCYGGPIKSPRIDQLAAGGIRFNHAYVQQPVCAASRASFLTGLRPDVTGVDYPYSHYFIEEILPEYGTISRFFAGKGYRVKQFGKVHHGYEDENPTYKPGRKGRYYTDSFNESVSRGGNRPPYEKTFQGDSEYVDYQIADSVASAIRKSRHSSAPFFYAVGFHKPHLVFASPEKYWDLYDEKSIALPVPRNLAAGSPDFAVDRYYLNQYEWEHSDPDTPFSGQYARLIRHAYYASASFVDAQVGMVLDALEESGLEEETIVLFVSDHGFLLGEQNYWGKTNLFEKGLQVPLIVSWKNHIEGGLETDALVEAVDIFPSLVDLAGFELPPYLEGTSFKPVTEDPDIAWKEGAISQQPRGLTADREGISLRTARYRYTEWTRNPGGEVIARELFDYEKDPAESGNLATDPENAELVKELSAQLNRGWKSLLPEGITNRSHNPAAPPSYAWGPEGVSRRAAWHEKFGGSQEEGWRKSTERRMGQRKFDPINENASPEARALLDYLYRIRGKKIISGHHNGSTRMNQWHRYVEELTGESPAIWGSDFHHYYEEGNPESVVREAIRRHSDGYIVTLMWHTGRPQDDPPFDWATSTQGEMSDREWKELTTPGTTLHSKWIARVDTIAAYLKQLRDANVPVLWRPYHEMNGIWFWWGDKKGEEGFAKLWKMMFDRYVHHHNLNNLIWVWNTNAPRDRENDEAYAYELYFPGLEYVDVLAADVYHNDYRQSHHDRLVELARGKVVSLGEVGEVPTPEILDAQPMWTWFMIWSRWVETHNTPEKIKALYSYPGTLSHKEIDYD